MNFVMILMIWGRFGLNSVSIQSRFGHQNAQNRAIYSNSAENFKRPKNREDSSDLDENLTESIAAMKTII